MPCPLNTKLDKEAADHCACAEGFFRAQNEGPGMACTGKIIQTILTHKLKYHAFSYIIIPANTAPPGPIPNELRIVTICDTSAVLEWDKPKDVGRSDFYYDISRSNPDTEETVVINAQYTDDSDVVNYTVTGLTQKTTYTFSVHVHNGVSEHDDANAKLRVVSKQGTTKQGSMYNQLLHQFSTL